MICAICNKKVLSDVVCENGHFICDTCHSSKAVDQIKSYCLSHPNSNPYILADELMQLPAVKMHGPEHHFLVPAALISAYLCNLDQLNLLETYLNEADKRSAHVPGGFCGNSGACGAGIGAGIFYSIITKATPLSTTTWADSHHVTADVLKEMAIHGGPRCCKRDSFLAISKVVEILNEKGMWSVTVDNDWVCNYHKKNKQCLEHACRFFPG